MFRKALGKPPAKYPALRKTSVLRASVDDERPIPSKSLFLFFARRTLSHSAMRAESSKPGHAMSLSVQMKSLHAAFCCVVAMLGACSIAQAQDTSRPYGGGGPINAPEIIRQYNQSGKQMRIEGSCQSSCTMLLAIKNVCVDPGATLMFHAALFPNEKNQKPPPARQARMLAAYNAKLRNYLVSNGYVDTFEFHSISGQDIIQKFGYRACK